MIYMLLTDGFEDIEALETLDIIRRAGLPIKTAGVKSLSVTSSHQVTVSADITLADIDANDMEMLILPGGPGHTAFNESKDVQILINLANDKEIFICAICASPSVIGKLGLLDGKKYTCFPGFEEMIPNGIYCDEKVVKDGRFVTAKGAGASSEFGFTIVEIFKGSEFAKELRKQMQY